MSITRARLIEITQFEEPRIELLSEETVTLADHVRENLRFRIGGTEVRGILTRPLGVEGRLPAILYAHSHGGGYHIGADELVDGREYLLDAPGPAFARAGYVTFCIDMPIFGQRSTVTESAASKALLWFGKSLLGQMLCEQAAALTYLSGRADVDPARIGAFGISMGCTLSYMLAAMDDRIAATAHLCCFADQASMIELGAHDGHGIYMVVPGLLNEADAGNMAALIAPRPQLVCIGEADGLTPPLAFRRAWAELEPAYAANRDRLELVLEPGIGHQETPRMRAATLAFFERWLGA